MLSAEIKELCLALYLGGGRNLRDGYLKTFVNHLDFSNVIL